MRRLANAGRPEMEGTRQPLTRHGSSDALAKGFRSKETALQPCRAEDKLMENLKQPRRHAVRGENGDGGEIGHGSTRLEFLFALAI